MRKKVLTSLIYLENRELANVFTKKQIALLEILAAQMSISLQNSLFYEKTERLYRSTERFMPKKFFMPVIYA